MIIRVLNIIILYFFYHNMALAINPTYDGSNGIKEKIFTTHCLFCHSSKLIGLQRNGAPDNINFDTFSGVLKNTDEIIVSAVNKMTMPPSSSGLPKLNQKQKEALLSWKAAGFLMGDTTSNITKATFDFTNFVLILPVISVYESDYQATLKLINIPGSPLGFGFIVEHAELTNNISESSALFSEESGELSIPEVSLINSPDGSNRVKVKMRLKPNSVPMQFEVISVI